MKILVTGGAGFIGSHLTETLRYMGHAVTVLDNLATGLRDNVGKGVQLIEADVRHAETLNTILSRERPETLYHLAGQMNVRKSISDPSEDADVNIVGGIRLFQASMAHGVRRIVYASSGGAAYGEQAGQASVETDLPQPSSPYGISKLAVEHYGRQFAQVSGNQFVALRLANVYGPRQNPRGEAGIVALFLHEMIQGRAPVIFGDGTQTRDFVWVGDVVDAFVRALEAPTGIYNIGTGRATSVNKIFHLLRLMTGYRGEPLYLPALRGEVQHNAICSDLAKELFGWAPEMALIRGLRETASSVLPESAPIDRLACELPPLP